MPYIDKQWETGQSKEEWKGMAETSKILRPTSAIPIDGLCVRIGAMRCHSQAITLKLNKNVPMSDIEQLIAQANDWVTLNLPNTRRSLIAGFNPTKVTGTLNIPVGRLRKMNMGPGVSQCFYCGRSVVVGRC